MGITDVYKEVQVLCLKLDYFPLLDYPDFMR